MTASVTRSGRGFNPFGRAWSAYERSLRRHPVLTQAASSALLWGLGDAMGQRIETRGRGGVDCRRAALTAGFGGAVIGPAGHCWYQLLDWLVLRLGMKNCLRAMLFKVTVDNLVYSPCYVLAFFAFGCMAIDGLSPPEFAEKMRQEFLPTMLAEAMVWPPYMAAVFSRVPVKHQLLAVNVATLFDVCFLSWVRTREDESEPSAYMSSPKEVPGPLKEHTINSNKSKSGGAQKEPNQQQAHPKHEQHAWSEAPMTASAPWDQSSRQLRQPLAEASLDASLVWPWDSAWDEPTAAAAGAPERALGLIALMAASATCSSSGIGGGGGVSWLRLGTAQTKGGSGARPE